MSGRMCSHKPTGFITNQDPNLPLDWDRAHASRVVCDRPACRDNVTRWVAGETNETARYYPFGQYHKAAS